MVHTKCIFQPEDGSIKNAIGINSANATKPDNPFQTVQMCDRVSNAEVLNSNLNIYNTIASLIYITNLLSEVFVALIRRYSYSKKNMITES